MEKYRIMDNVMKCICMAAAILSAACACNKVEKIVVTENKAVVVEYSPAPGQFINDGFDCTTMAEAVAWAQSRIDDGFFVSLGAFGGYIVVEMSSEILNEEGYDFSVAGNPFDQSSEPGVVWVSQDGISWFQLEGKDREFRNRSVTYYRPEGGEPADVKWKDSEGNEGIVQYLPQFHRNSCFPAWVDSDEYTLTGTRLEARDMIDGNGIWKSGTYMSGYVDNWASDMEEKAAGQPNRFDIDDAVDSDGNPVSLPSIKFIKVQTAVISMNPSPAVGEMSTEVVSFKALH